MKPYADFISARGIDVDQYTITVDAGKGGMHMNIIHGKVDGIKNGWILLIIIRMQQQKIYISLQEK